MANIWFSSDRMPLMRSRMCTPAAMSWPSLSSNEGVAPSIENFIELGIICNRHNTPVSFPFPGNKQRPLRRSAGIYLSSQ